MIQLLQKSTPSNVFDEIQQVVLDGISDNMASLVESENCGAISTTYTTTNEFYVIMFTSEAYTLHDNIPDNQGLSIIDVHATKAYGIRQIPHTPLPSFGSKRKW